MFVNNKYVRNGEIDTKQLFKRELITEKMIEKGSTVHPFPLMKVLQRNPPPQQDIGAHCTTPFECEYKHHCWKHVPEYSVFNLFKKKKAEELYNVYGPEIAKLPKECCSTDNERIDVRVFSNNEEHVDKGAISKFLKTLEYPLYFLDYETVRHATFYKHVSAFYFPD